MIRDKKNKPINILLIDDNPFDVSRTKSILSEMTCKTFTISTAYNLNSGLEILQFQEVDILLLDLFLPDSFGIYTLKKVKNLHPALPVVVLTGYGDRDFEILINEFKAQYVSKNCYDHDILLSKINNAIQLCQNESNYLITEHSY